jgi:hypothetical protein
VVVPQEHQLSQKNIAEPPREASSNGVVGGLVASRVKPRATIAPNETHAKHLTILSMT